MSKLAYRTRRNLGQSDECGTAQKLALFLAVSVVILGLSTAGLAQELAATLTGTVTDPSGALVAGATVVVHSNETGIDVRTVTTTNTGSFNITNLPAGRYTVTVKDAGFQTFVANEVVLNVAEKHTLDVQLKTGKTSETIEVVAENTPIQTTTAEESGTVTGEQVRELALNNRNFEQLILLQPGVANQLPDKVGFGLANNTSISVNGARTGANNYTVDGADINDSGSNGTLLNTPSIDAIQEFTLERSNYDASFGRSGGGQIVVATKSGTNQIHGSAYEFNRNNFYNANTFGRPCLRLRTGKSHYRSFATEILPSSATTTLVSPSAVPCTFRRFTTRTRQDLLFLVRGVASGEHPGPECHQCAHPAELAGSFTSPVTIAPAGCVTNAGG